MKNIIIRYASAALLLNGIILVSAPASAAALIQRQAPCTTAGGGPCKNFGSGAIPAVIRSIAFSAPSKGDAAVSITGSMTCGHVSGSAQKVADFVTQIVPNAGAVPDIAGPSAIRHAMRLGPPGPDGLGLSTSFNLASTRVFPINAAGVKQYFFNLGTLRMDPAISCTIYDAAFTIVFIP